MAKQMVCTATRYSVSIVIEMEMSHIFDMVFIIRYFT